MDEGRVTSRAGAPLFFNRLRGSPTPKNTCDAFPGRHTSHRIFERCVCIHYYISGGMAILVIFVFFVLPPILGLIVLICVPTFRLTFINFLLFVVGAILGMFALGNLIMLVLENLGNHRTIREEN